jgi:hypothetical protein
MVGATQFVLQTQILNRWSNPERNRGNPSVTPAYPSQTQSITQSPQSIS